MASAVDGLRPELMWKYFAEISRIPRGSKNEAAISKYLVNTAKSLGLQVKTDKVGNVVVKKPASPGRERVRSVCLQGHMDMVCEKNKDKVHDFLKDPIEIVRQGNVLTANGTTLGADNGVAVAANLAIMADRSLEHGPLELLFTVDEETGLTGANNLVPDFLESRTLLNLDSEEEGALYVGCSGGRDTIGTWAVDFEDAPAGSVVLELKVTGLRGGHSGLEIDKGRGNALKIINRVLIALTDRGARLASVDGGNKHNAIPREAFAVLALPKAKVDEARALAGEWAATVRAECATVDPDLSVTLEVKGGRKPRVIKKAQVKKILLTIAALPHGVTKMSADIPGLVETSTNVAVLRTSKKEVSLATSQRSSVASEIAELCQTVGTIFTLGGAAATHSDGYPGWKPNMGSEILRLARETYRSLSGRDPAVKAIHAGLECGIIGEKFPGMDMVSFGPTLEGVHTPDEKIHIDTVEKFWILLVTLLRNVT